MSTTRPLHWERCSSVEVMLSVIYGRPLNYVPCAACGPMTNPPPLTRVISQVTCKSCMRTASYKWSKEHPELEEVLA